MDFIKRMLRLARESDSWSPEAKGFESSALSNIRGMVSFWADLNTLSGRPLNGHEKNAWAKEVLNRIIELDEIFKEDEKLRKEVEK